MDDHSQLFYATRGAGATALGFSKNWLAEPIRTAEAYTEFYCRRVFGRIPEEQQAIIHSIFCDALLMGRWAMSGFPTIELGHSTAAAFMATKIRADDAVEFMRAPWPAFAVRLPVPLLTIDSEEHGPRDASLLLAGSVDRRLVPNDEKSDTPRWWVKLLAPSPLARRYDQSTMPLHGAIALWSFNVPTDLFAEKAGAFAFPGAERWDNTESTTADQRTEELSRALIVASCLYLGTNPGVDPSPHASSVTVKRSTSKQRDGDLPPYTRYEVRSAMKINLTQAIRDYAKHGGGTPSVQTMVHGHWKRQAIGPGRAQRKLIHVEAYWRGDVNAPISERTK